MAKPIILLVDDDKTMLNSLMDQMRNAFRSEYLIESAQSLDEARSLVAMFKSDGQDVKLIISDWLMPPERSNDFLEEVFANHPDIALIMLSGYADEDAIRRAVDNAHIRAFIRKPWEEDELLAEVRNALTQA